MMKRAFYAILAVLPAMQSASSQTVINGSRQIVGGGLDAGKATYTRVMTGVGAPASALCNTAKTITAATAASPPVATSTSHGFNNGDIVVVYGTVVGMTGLTGTFVAGSVTTNTFALCGAWDGTNCQSPPTTSGAYTSGAVASTQVGREYFRQDATAGQNKYYCTDSTGSPAWAQQAGSSISALAGQGRFLYTGYADSAASVGIAANPNRGVAIRFSVDGQLRFDKLNVHVLTAGGASSGLLIATYSADLTTRRCNTTAISTSAIGAKTLVVSGSDPDVSSGVCILPAGGYNMVFTSDVTALVLMALVDGNSGAMFNLMNTDSTALSANFNGNVSTGTGTGLAWTGTDLSAVSTVKLTGNHVIPVVWMHNGN